MFVRSCGTALILIVSWELSITHALGQCSPIEVTKLLASDAAPADNFGISAALSGNTAIVGSWGDDTPGGVDAGSAYIFIRSGALWTQQAKLTANDGATNDSMGISVAISADTAVVGVFNDTTPAGANAGSAYVFTRSGTVWTQQAKLTASDAAASDQFAVSVAIDGDTIVVGCEQDNNAAGLQAGAAYVFVRNGTVWTQQAKLTANDAAADDNFGYSVAIESNTIVVSSHRDDTPAGTNAGSAYVFTRSGTVWTQQAKLTASDGAANDELGISVSLSGDTAIIGASTDDNAGGNNAGAAYIFIRMGTSWFQQAKVTASDGAVGDLFGISVAIHGDVALIGSYLDDPPLGTDAGSAYVFTRANGIWTQQSHLLASDGANNDEFGYVVALSGDTAVLGVFSDDTAAGNDAGSVYIFGLGCDNDGDGVINAVDACPNNAPGLPVCDNGRPLRDCNGDCLYDAADVQCLVDELLSN